ncbi:hypothetical protein SPRG_05132 [Saprolegnia parasitica CBS 223.65]|uniref:Dynactin subunit 2 n=1 Tax=Saprolegnia parasitica (strain CBS 223.65) TaxID=695850 RepID=A0A067CT18_SAPPC|nr:hypothetical protein SPRG_05132 [Saprolegnia parasitica CBS 223.65]KDO29942.1 hypothetical protein SPRG_05132 [Saprolegnia parasitica CBS 223.65]|eukprot:XP_012199126.1 hypothetical protein SPRG_05132 [Saprolegnia parasitica CBS 223.65]
MAARRVLEETEVYETPEEEVYPVAPVAHAYAHMDDSLASESNEIDRHGVRPADAFHAFLGRSMSVTKEEVKVVPRGDLETPAMRYHRLQMEMGELEGDLALLQTMAQHDPAAPSYASMLQGLRTLQQNLSQMDLGATSALTQNSQSHVQQQLSTQLFKDLQAFRDQAATGEPADGVVYEVYALPESREQKHATVKLASIEQRLVQLEKAVGGPTASRSILHAINDLEGRMALLQPAELDAISSRVSALLHDLTAVSKLQDLHGTVQQSILTAQESSQLNVMREKLQSVSATAAALPALVEKLTSLRALHQDASTFSTRLQTLETSHDHLKEILSTDAALLRNMEANLAANVAVFAANMESLDKRMDALLQRSS